MTEHCVQIPELPNQLVDRLEQLFLRMDIKNEYSWKRFLGMMHNADHRYEMLKEGILVGQDPQFTHTYGLRVRSLDVHNNFPDVTLILKRTHGPDAEKTISIVRKRIAMCKESGSEVVEIPAYPVADKVIAMPRVDAPSAYEMYHFGSEYWSGTDRGKLFRTRLEDEGVAEAFIPAVYAIKRMSLITPGNLLYLGRNDDRFVFAPLVDYE